MQRIRQLARLSSRHLSTTNAAIFAGGSIGLIQTWNVDRPLSSLFIGSIVGTVYGIGAELVHSMLPRRLTPIIPISCACFVVKHIFFPSPKKPLVEIEIQY